MRAISMSLLLTLLTPLQCFAQVNPYSNAKISSHAFFTNMADSQIDEFCKSGQGGTQELIWCAKHDWEKADKQLKTVFNKKIEEQKQYDIKNNLDSASYMGKAQEYWLLYRENTCNAEYFP